MDFLQFLTDIADILQIHGEQNLCKTGKQMLHFEYQNRLLPSAGMES